MSISAQDVATGILDHKMIIIDQDTLNVFPEAIHIVIKETRKQAFQEVIRAIEDIRLSDEYYDLTPGSILDQLQVKFEARAND